MFRSKRIRGLGLPLSFLSVAGAATAAVDHRDALQAGSRSGAYAGASVRLGLGGGESRPSARLQLGMRSVSGDRHSAGRTLPALELGLGGSESGALFIGGRPKAEIERKLGMKDGGIGTTAVLLFSAALLAVGVYVIVNLDRLDTDD